MFVLCLSFALLSCQRLPILFHFSEEASTLHVICKETFKDRLPLKPNLDEQLQFYRENITFLEQQPLDGEMFCDESDTSVVFVLRFDFKPEGYTTCKLTQLKKACLLSKQFCFSIEDNPLLIVSGIRRENLMCDGEISKPSKKDRNRCFTLLNKCIPLQSIDKGNIFIVQGKQYVSVCAYTVQVEDYIQLRDNIPVLITSGSMNLDLKSIYKCVQYIFKSNTYTLKRYYIIDTSKYNLVDDITFVGGEVFGIVINMNGDKSSHIIIYRWLYDIITDIMLQIPLFECDLFLEPLSLILHSDILSEVDAHRNTYFTKIVHELTGEDQEITISIGGKHANLDNFFTYLKGIKEDELDICLNILLRRCEEEDTYGDVSMTTSILSTKEQEIKELTLTIKLTSSKRVIHVKLDSVLKDQYLVLVFDFADGSSAIRWFYETMSQRFIVSDHGWPVSVYYYKYVVL